MAAFVREWLPLDLVSLTSLALLLVLGLVTPEQGVSGFANEAVVTVMMIFILSAGVLKSGLIAKLAHRLSALSGTSHWKGSILLLVVAGTLSAFINNVAALTIFMPVSIHMAHHYRISPSKVLLPLSYATIFGGACTLIGTSTNLLISSLSRDYDFRAFTMFEFSSLGLVLVVVGMVYTVLIMMRRLPDRDGGESLAKRYLSGYLTELEVSSGSKLIGQTLVEAQVNERFHVNVLEVIRGQKRIVDLVDERLEEGDRLILYGAVNDIVSFSEQRGLKLLPERDPHEAESEMEAGDNVLLEVQIAPGSRLVGRSLRALDFRRRFGAQVVALKRTGELIREQLGLVTLERWDILLVFGPRRHVDALAEREDLVNLEEVGVHLEVRRDWWLTTGIMVTVVSLASLGIMPILEASILGAVAMLVTRCLTMQEAYQAINWTVIFLVAAILPMGKAMTNTGLDGLIGDGLAHLGDDTGPILTLSLIYVVTTVLTEVMSNNTTAVLMVPVAVSTAAAMGFEPFPFVMAVAFGASASFLTPMGYKTNAMVYGPGGYRFMDYIRFGAPLKVVFWLISVLLIPLLWPLQGVAAVAPGLTR